MFESEVVAVATRGKPAYKSADEIKDLIDAYFADCEGEVACDKKGDPILNKYGEVVYMNRRPPTVTGLALALGFNSRQSLLNYQGKKEFCEVITRAKTRIEMYTEERLFDKDGAAGARFSLQNNFKGWNESAKEAAGALASAVQIVNDIPKSPPTVVKDDAENNG